MSDGLPLRRCGLCRMWYRRPCGDGCGFDLRDPTWEQVVAAAQSSEAQPIGSSERQRAEGNAPGDTVKADPHD